MPETQYYTKHYQSKTTASETSLPQNTKKKKKKKKSNLAVTFGEGKWEIINLCC